MKKLKQWLEKQIRTMNDDNDFSAGNKWGHKCGMEWDDIVDEIREKSIALGRK